MNAVEFLKERARMCDTHKKHCRSCPASVLSTCSHPKEEVEAEQLVAVVKKWSEEHQYITNGHKLLSELKKSGANARYTSSGLYNAHIRLELPVDWWDAEYKETK